jgi:ribonuclease III
VAPKLEPKVQLQRAIGVKGVSITYKDEGEPKKEKKSGLPWYTVGAYLTGWGETNLRLGGGSAFSKREAGAKAAIAALGNKKQMKIFEQKKQDHTDALQAQRERDQKQAVSTSL